MAPKDESELTIMKKACQATQDLFKKFLREQIMEIIDSDKVRDFDGVTERRLSDGFYLLKHIDNFNSGSAIEP